MNNYHKILNKRPAAAKAANQLNDYLITKTSNPNPNGFDLSSAYAQYLTDNELYTYDELVNNLLYSLKTNNPTAIDLSIKAELNRFSKDPTVFEAFYINPKQSGLSYIAKESAAFGFCKTAAWSWLASLENNQLQTTKQNYKQEM